MTFNLKTKSIPSTGTNTARLPKACGFLNLWVTQSDGRRTKLGAIALRTTKRSDRALMDYLSSREDNIDKLKEALELDFVDVSQLPDKPSFSL